MTTWNISQLEVKPSDGEHNDVVVTAHWDAVATEDGFNARVYGTASFPAPAEEFTPFPDLTLEQVLGWVWDNGVDKDATEASLAAQIESQKNPPIIRPPLPWTQNPETEEPTDV
jgi:hypothetical protein